MKNKVAEGEKVSGKTGYKSGGKKFSINKTKNSPEVSLRPVNDLFLEKTLGFTSQFQAHLTEREKQILKLIVAGETNKQIAHKLCRTRRTVEYHRNRLMSKLEVHNAAELVRLAIAKSLI